MNCGNIDKPGVGSMFSGTRPASRCGSETLAKPRAAVAIGKALFYRQLEKGIASAYADASQTMACNMMDAAALEGVQAFIDPRRPDWPD